MKIKWTLMLITGTILLLVMSSSFIYIYKSQEKRAEESYYALATSHSVDIAMIRHTISKQGGTYVKKSDTIKTNPYLADIPGLKVDIQDTEGNEYTLLNAFTFIREMTDEMAQSSDIIDKKKVINYRVPSTIALNPINNPDEHEKEILEKFENGEISEFTQIEKDENGERIYRYMSPVISSKKCLKCHDYGEKMGSVVGAISLLIPIEEAELHKESALRNILLFFLGSSFFMMGTVYLISNHISKPIILLSNAGQRIRNGEMGVKVENNVRIDEIKTLGSTFNQMTQELQDKIDQLSIDISRRKKAEKKLRESEEKYRDLFENASDLIQSIDKDGKFYFVNKKWLKTLGYSHDEINDITFLDIVKHEFVPHCDDILNRVQNGETIVNEETVFITKDGEEIYVEGNINGLFKDGVFIASRGIFRDITDRKMIEEASFLASITENSYDAIASLDLDGSFITWNKGAEEIFGYQKEDVISRPFGFIIPEEFRNTCLNLFESADEFGFLRGVETTCMAIGGRHVPVELTISKLIGKMGKHIGYTIILRDISERKFMEGELYKRQEELIEINDELEFSNIELKKLNNLKDLFTDIMRHDLLNPAGIIRTYTEFMMEDKPGDEDLELINKNSKKLIGMIENASAFSKLESVDEIELSDLNLKEILEGVCNDLRPAFEAENVELICNISKDMPIKANLMIEDVFINFLSNALKYAPEGKRVIFKAEEKDDRYRVSVIDFGAGIPDEHKEGIFNRFSRASKGAVKGTGLGLAIVVRLLELHDGKVWVEDNPAGGSIFIVELPREKIKIDPAGTATN